MKPALIHQLNQLNQDFYSRIATSFDETRQRPWEGWQEIAPIIQEKFSKHKSFTLLDLGCGNGRLAAFLAQALPDFKIEYLGIDSNMELLQKARTQLETLDNIPQAELLTADLCNQSELEKKAPHTYDVVAVFGVMHHLPSFELRKKFLDWCWEKLPTGGILLLSFWHFTQSKQFKRHLNTTEIAAMGIPVSELEKNDYFLDWQRGKKAVRYCHLIDREEELKLIDLSKWLYLKNFTADTSNYYLFLQKK